MGQRGVDALQFRDVVGVGDVYRTQVLGAESCQTLLGNRNTDFFDRVDVGNFVKDLLLIRVEGEEGEVFGVEKAEDVFMEIEQNLIKVAGRMDLAGNPLDVFRELHLLLKFL